MSERDTYPHGVPCWVANLQRDPMAAVAFYEGLMGWEPVVHEGWAVGRLRGRDVAGIGTMPESAGDAPAAWTTHVRVDELAPVVERVLAAGGEVIEADVDLSPIGRLAVFTDPQGALLCAWVGGDREGAQVINEPGAWAMSALVTDDPEPAVAFYHAVFGWEPEAFGPATLFRLPGYVGGEPSQPVARDVVAAVVPPTEAMPDAPTRWSVDFWIADVDAAAATVERGGGRVIAGPYDAGPFRQAEVADPEGATFTLSQLVAPPG
jgi:predicted enzyme related to lactoylglutathione lyase